MRPVKSGHTKLKSISGLLKKISFKNSSLLTKQIVSFLIITIIPISAINYIWFVTTTDIIEDQSIQYTNQIFRQINQSIKHSLEEINNISLSILFYNQANEFLSK